MRDYRFDLNLLYVLDTLLQERSVTRAGGRLGRTQSAVSNSLARLRHTFDDPLFVRGSNGLDPTPRARALEQPVREILRRAAECLNPQAPFDPAIATARLRLGAPDRLGLPLIAPLITRIRQRAPGLHLDLQTTDREPALTLLDSGQLDLLIGWFDRAPQRQKAELLFREKLFCLCGPRHPLVIGKAEPDLADILAYPHLVVSSAGDRQTVFDIMLASVGQRRDAALSVSNFSLVPTLLLRHEMVGVYTERIATALSRAYDLARFPLPLEIEPLSHFLVWNRRDDADPQHGWLRAQIIDLCRD